MGKFTEAKLEEAFVEVLADEGYPHKLGSTLVRSEDEVLIEDDLRAFLKERYKLRIFIEGYSFWGTFLLLNII